MQPNQTHHHQATAIAISCTLVSLQQQTTLTDSPIWSDLLKVKDLYLHGRSIKICNRQKTRFWSDIWLYDKALATIAPTLFILCEQKEAKVFYVKHGLIQITFRRWLTDELQHCWDLIQSDVNNFELQNSDDIIFWRLEKNRRFSVKSL
jgi:hypothetical protein